MGREDEPEASGLAGERPAGSLARAGARLRGLAVDLSPLRSSRDFRLLFWSFLVSETGHQITHVALYYQVFRLTGSPAAVGFIGLAVLVPLIASTIGLGHLVDRVDRRKLLLLTQVGFAFSSGVLVLGAFHGPPFHGRPPLALLYGAAALTAALSGIESPTRSAMIPNLISRDRLPAALALNQVMWNATMLVGPAVGGLIIAKLGLSWAYGIDAITYGVTFAAAIAMRPMRPKRDEADTARGWAAVKEGFAFLKGRRVLQSTFSIDLNAMIFGMPRALFPILALEKFHVGPQGLGLLYAAPALGAVLGAVASGWVGRVRHQGKAVMVAVVMWGLAIAAFGLSGSLLGLALVFLAIAGAADVVSAVFRSTILQLSVPDALRGRLSAIHIMVVAGGPRLGDVEAGLVAAAVSPTFSVVSGGVACVLGVGLIGLLVPEFARYHSGDDELVGREELQASPRSG